jgi:regulator of protease activity HflC (stomatin/prohibitin superfamily)
MSVLTVILSIIIVLVVIILGWGIRIVPQKTAYVVERLGKYFATWDAGLHVLIPFIDKVAYKHSLKEAAIDVPPQSCITKDNIAIEVDGVLYLQIFSAEKASYGISNLLFASIQLAQTTMRSQMGQIELDKTFEEREKINGAVVDALDKASEPWGVKIIRYEIKNIQPPQTIRDAMEKQMRAEREKRAVIAESEGAMQAKINVAEGDKREFILKSEGEKQKRINEAEGRAAEIKLVAEATATGIREIAKSIGESNGLQAVNLRVAEQFVLAFGNLAKTNNSMIIPANLSDMAGLIATAMTVIKPDIQQK